MDCASQQAWPIRSFNFLFLLALFVVAGCQTVPTKFEELNHGKWNARILFKDIRPNGKSQVVNAVIIGKKPGQFRLEIISSLGQHLASIVKSGKQLQLLAVSDKVLFEGPATSKAFARATGVALDPQVVFDALFDQEPLGFECVRQKNGFLEKCEDKAQGIRLEWQDREVSRKRVLIVGAEFMLQMQLQGFSTEVQFSDSTFQLDLPTGFKRQAFPQKQ